MNSFIKILELGLGKVILLYGVLVILAIFPMCDDSFDRIIEEESLMAGRGGIPVPGDGGRLYVTAITADSCILHWTRAADTPTSQSQLQYAVYRSNTGNISSYEDAQSETQVTPGWVVDIDSLPVSALPAETTSYFNVFVRDLDNNVSPYVMTSASTGGDILFIYSAGRYEGDLTTLYTTSARGDIDNYCSSHYLYTELPVSQVRAFISISSGDEIADFPSNYGIPTTYVVKGPTGIKIADDWADLMDGDIDVNLRDAAVINGPWWSGSEDDGEFIVGYDCSGWASESSSDEGETGAQNRTNGEWMESAERPCNQSLDLLCIGW